MCFPISKWKRNEIVKPLVEYVRGIQKGCAIDSDALVEPSEMPGYESKIVMASGSFVQGSSIELSCDAPIREPYVAFQQGGLTYEYGKIAICLALFTANVISL